MYRTHTTWLKTLAAGTKRQSKALDKPDGESARAWTDLSCTSNDQMQLTV